MPWLRAAFGLWFNVVRASQDCCTIACVHYRASACVKVVMALHAGKPAYDSTYVNSCELNAGSRGALGGGEC